MSVFKACTLESAPTEAQPLLKQVQDQIGFIPNLYAHLAQVPVALKAYTDICAQFEQSSLTAIERQVVLLAASVENADAFCVSAHSHVALHLVGMEEATIGQLRCGGSLSDPRLDALATFTRNIVRLRGWGNGMPLASFLGAGFSLEQALEVMVGITAKMLSNYANHLMSTELNPDLRGLQWEAPSRLQ